MYTVMYIPMWQWNKNDRSFQTVSAWKYCNTFCIFRLLCTRDSIWYTINDCAPHSASYSLQYNKIVGFPRSYSEFESHRERLKVSFVKPKQAWSTVNIRIKMTHDCARTEIGRARNSVGLDACSPNHVYYNQCNVTVSVNHDSANHDCPVCNHAIGQ